MSYSTPDFADDVQSALTERGYSIVEEHGLWFWTFGPRKSPMPYDTASSAWEGAHSHCMEAMSALQMASLNVVNKWTRGNLAEAVRGLQQCLMNSIPTTKQAFEEAQG